MNPFRRVTSCLLIAVAAAGCSTTVERASGAAIAGHAYADTLKRVNDLALERAISLAARDLATQAARDATTLAKANDENRARLQLVAEANERLDSLAKYFANLEALARRDGNSAQAGFTLGNIANVMIKQPIGPLTLFNDDAKNALTGLINRQSHASSVEEALQRDADVVANSIAASDAMLATAATWIEGREAPLVQQAYDRDIVAPFIGNATLDGGWQSAWRTYVRTPLVISVIGEARKASAEMQQAWRSVLSGNSSFEAVLQSLRKVQAGVDAAAAGLAR